MKKASDRLAAIIVLIDPEYRLDLHLRVMFGSYNHASTVEAVGTYSKLSQTWA